VAASLIHPRRGCCHLNHSDGVKIEVSPELLEALSKIQVELHLDLWDAGKELAYHANRTSEQIAKAVNKEADRLAKSRFFDQLNRMRNKIFQEGYMRGVEYTRKNESNFSLPCKYKTCVNPLRFSSLDSDWPRDYQVMLKAFAGYSHVGDVPQESPIQPSTAQVLRLSSPPGRCLACGNLLTFWLERGQIYKYCQNTNCSKHNQPFYHGPAL
jgi:hypothetical protein